MPVIAIASRPGKFENNLIIGAPDVESETAQGDLSGSWAKVLDIPRSAKLKRLLVVYAEFDVDVAIVDFGGDPNTTVPLRLRAPSGGTGVYVGLADPETAEVYVRTAA